MTKRKAFMTVWVVTLITGCSGKPAEVVSAPRPIAWVDVVNADEGAIRHTPAIIQSKNRAELAFQVPGRVDKVNVRVGDQVDDNAVLALLNDDTFRLALAQTRAELTQANAAYVEAQAEFERDADLIKDGAISETEYERSRARLDTARGSVNVLTAAVGIAQENLDRTQLRAPYAGEITFRQIEPAQQVPVGQTVLGIQIDSVLEATMTVPEDWINRLSMGSQHNVTLRTLPGVVVEGRITEIGRDARANNAYPITLELDNPPETVRSGMSAEVTLIGSSNSNGESVVIPVTAFASGVDQNNYVFVYDSKASVVRQRVVELGDIVAEGIVVTSGLQIGDRIAAKGVTFLNDGQAVSLMNVGPQQFLQ